MAKVPLRKYNSEIETLIDRGQTDEAIAHCRHILKTFPKHLETYRLLGKSYLEAKRYAEATDIFQRILMSAPGDFVSHVGMSIMADEQKRLDDAIWHMERAFETQTSNAAIQAELQRLYGRRDGMEPPKIRLTRGALAHMYVHGELFAQAIAEIRTVLAEDPNRTDMQALLALAHFRAGQKVEASETCTQLIGRFPYCLDANRILMEILPGTGMAENVQVYRTRVIELDPYTAYTSGSVFLTSEVPDSSVSVERLDYKGKPVEISPEWDRGKGIGAAQPEWMKPSKPEPAAEPSFDFAPRSAPAEPDMAFDFGADKSSDSPFAGGFDFASQNAAAEPSQPEPGAAAPDGDAIPEWLRDAGWGESTGAFDESTANIAEEPSVDLPKADLPDWIKSMAPVAAAVPAPTPAPAPVENDDTLDWLNKLGGDTPFESIQEKPLESVSEKPLEDFTSPVAPTGPDLTPDWLADFDAVSKAPAAPDETSAWLSTLDSDQPAAPAPSAPLPPAASLGDLGTSASEQDEAMRWLESLAANQGAKSEELLTKPEERMEKPPEWVEQAKAVGESILPAYEPEPEPEPAPEIELTQPPAVEGTTPPIPLSELGTTVEEQDQAMLWLESLAAKQGAKSEELLTRPEDRMEKPPEWVEQAKAVGESILATPPPVEEETPHPTRPIWREKEIAEIPPAEPEFAAADQTGVWLSRLEEKDQKPETPVEAEPAAWSGEIEFAPPPAAPSAEPSMETDLPTWLRGLEEREAAQPAPASDDLPDWLRGDEKEVPAPPAPTIPADWMPETPVVTPAPPEPKPEPVLKEVRKPEPVKKEARKPEPKPEAVDRSKLKRTGMLPPLVDPTLTSARDAFSHGKIPDALQAYSALIRKGKLLEDVTFDLKEALYRFPVEVSIWQALGDAYMRANRLQDALDAYTKAEELLR